MKISKNSPILSCLAAMMLTGTALAAQKSPADNPPVAGTSTGVIGVTVEESVVVANGWSVKKHLLGRPVYNDKGERLGKVEDIIVTSDKSLSFAIIGAGGFLGIATHDVAIPINQIKFEHDRFLLPGATKEVIRAMPEFHYAK